MRRAAKLDARHNGIVLALRKAGCSVQSLAAVGGGVPDLLVGRAGVIYLLEVKDPPGPQGGTSRDGQRLNGRQEMWRAGWRAPVAVVTSAEEALRAVGL